MTGTINVHDQDGHRDDNRTFAPTPVTRRYTKCWSVKASLRDAGSLKEAFTDQRALTRAP
ncbi:hypothetical protein AVR91_0218750 [Amycolatopsis keratiniphila subsp. keratiniphila]|uniref:Uncharacterized protein n=1 Tax=Amycolatopsis keratiniphila subsp. keratiniphila TaxID=227715 RepID=A0A1W2LTK6_9PSEU|nr:hypothetical protein AVR91_0218750 [Amycolatopsis keratiniphila subsp. keratiniphila]